MLAPRGEAKSNANPRIRRDTGAPQRADSDSMCPRTSMIITLLAFMSGCSDVPTAPLCEDWLACYDTCANYIAGEGEDRFSDDLGVGAPGGLAVFWLDECAASCRFELGRELDVRLDHYFGWDAEIVDAELVAFDPAYDDAARVAALMVARQARFQCADGHAHQPPTAEVGR